MPVTGASVVITSSVLRALCCSPVVRFSFLKVRDRSYPFQSQAHYPSPMSHLHFCFCRPSLSSSKWTPAVTCCWGGDVAHCMSSEYQSKLQGPQTASPLYCKSLQYHRDIFVMIYNERKDRCSLQVSSLSEDHHTRHWRWRCWMRPKSPRECRGWLVPMNGTEGIPMGLRHIEES